MSFNPFTLKGKRILVTGASSGLGKSISINLSKIGANVFLTGRNKERLDDTVKSLEKGDHESFPIDLTNQNSIDEVVDKLPPLNGIVHSAGILEIRPFKKLVSKGIHDMMKLNYLIPIDLTIKILKKQLLIESASIVFISSINGLNIAPKGFSNYAGTKAALNGIVKSMAHELSPTYRVNSIAPGMVDSPMTERITNIVGEENILNDKKEYPLGRYGRPEDVAYAAIYLLSDASNWVTGSTLIIDGGRSIK